MADLLTDEEARVIEHHQPQLEALVLGALNQYAAPSERPLVARVLAASALLNLAVRVMLPGLDETPEAHGGFLAMVQDVARQVAAATPTTTAVPTTTARIH